MSSIQGRPAAHRIHHFAVHYPEEWGTTLNPGAPAVERRVEAWLRRLGVVDGTASLEVLRNLHVAGYGGWPFPSASPHRLETITRFLTLWIFYDDRIEGHGEPREEALLAAIRGEEGAAGLDDPCLRGWWEIARRYRGAMSSAWLDRLGTRFLEWARSLRDEAAQVSHMRAGGGHPSLADYLSVREISVGLLPTLGFIEYDLGAELPASLHEHPAMRELCRLAAWVVAIFNDLLAFSKDERARWVNAVSSARHERDRGLAFAFARTVALHNRCVFRMLAVEESLLADPAGGPLLRAWLERLHQIVPGLARWQLEARRYSSAHLISADEEVHLGSPWEADLQTSA